MNPSQTPSQNAPNSCSFAPARRGSLSDGGSISDYPIRRKARRDDVLGNLSDADQDQVLSWLQEMSLQAAVEQIAKPRPEGLGLKTHRTSLRRFYAKRSLLDSNLDFETLSGTGQHAPFNPETFALICRKLEEEILVGLDCMVGRGETIRLLSVYVRLRALHLKTTKPNARGRFRPQFEPFNPAFVPEPAEPVQEPGGEAAFAEAPLGHAPNAPQPVQSRPAPSAQSAWSGTPPPDHTPPTEQHFGHVSAQPHNAHQISTITPISNIGGHA